MNETFCILIKISRNFFSKGPINKNSALDNGLALKRRQAIIWTNADPIRWGIYAALGGDDFNIAITIIIHINNNKNIMMIIMAVIKYDDKNYNGY